MTVKELIDELKKYNQNAEIKIDINDFYYEPHIDLKPDSCSKQISHEHKTITYNYMVVLSVYSG